MFYINNRGLGTGITTFIITLGLLVGTGTILQAQQKKPVPPDKRKLIKDKRPVTNTTKAPSAKSNQSISVQSAHKTLLTPRNTGNNALSRSRYRQVFKDSKGRLYALGGYFRGPVDILADGQWMHWNIGNELPANPTDILTDANGRIYVSTKAGLLIFGTDLTKIKKITASNSRLVRNEIQTMEITTGGHIWLGHRLVKEKEDTTKYFGGISVYAPSQDSIVKVFNSGITATPIHDVKARSNGDIWAAATSKEPNMEKGIFVYRPSADSSWTLTKSNSGLPGNNITVITEDSSQNVWMCKRTGIVRFDGTNWNVFDASNSPLDNNCNTLGVDSQNRIYFGSRDTTLRFDGSQWSPFTGPKERFPLDGLHSVFVTANGKMMFATRGGEDLTGGGIHISDSSGWRFISTQNDGGIFSNTIFGLSADSKGGVWATGFRGVARYDGTKWTYYNIHDGLASTYVWKVHVADNGTVWFGNSSRGVTRLSNGTFSVFDKWGPFVESIHEDAQGNIWMGSFASNPDNPDDLPGILQYDGTAFTRFDTSDVIGKYVYAIGEDPNGNIYASTNKGIARYNESSWSAWQHNRIGSVRELASGPEQQLWIASDSLYKWDGNQLKAYAPEGGIGGNHIEVSSEGSVWLAGFQSTDIFVDGNWYSLSHQGYAYDIAHEADGTTWIGGYKAGLFKFDRFQVLPISRSLTFTADLLVAGAGDGESQLTLGRKSGASDGFDSDFDIYAPPLPPSGAFDARFLVSNNDLIKDIRGTQNSRETWTISLQASDASYPVTLSWDPSILPDTGQVTLSFSDGMQQVDMTRQDSVSISDSSVKVINITHSLNQPVNYTLRKGWNLVGRPIDVNNAHYLNLFPSAMSNTLFGFNGSYALRDSLKVGQGYWLRVGETGSRTIRGIPVQQVSISVREGWNLIAGPMGSVNWSDIEDPGQVLMDNTLFSFSGSYQTASTVEPGRGYWVRANSSGQITLKAGVSSGKERGEPYPDGFARITITDGSGNGQTLYFDGQAEDKSLESTYLMPPLPPEGAFDARLEDNRRLTISSTANVRLQSAESPLTVKIAGKKARQSTYVVHAGNTKNRLQGGESIKIQKGGVEQLTVKEAGERQIPETYRLQNNYPNPFNPTTTIRYGLPRASDVQLSIYNINGRRVAKPVDRRQKAGWHEVKFNANQLASGVYIYQIEAGNFKQARKMILLK